MTVFQSDLQLEALYAQALSLLEGAPDGDSQGRVEVRKWRDRSGKISFTVEQYSGSGAWGGPSTTDIRAANLAAEILSISIGAVWTPCRECNDEERAT